MKKNTTVKLVISYHKPDVFLHDEILTPVHVGRKILEKKAKTDRNAARIYEIMSANTLGDDTGHNISEKNPYYNEMTAVYWAWKNYDKLDNPEYIGFMHYRRHFVFKESDRHQYDFDKIDENYLKMINYSPENVIKAVTENDFVYHLGRVNGIFNHYCENHKPDDLTVALDIMEKRHPEYKKVAQRYLEQDYGNFCNMFIFPRDLFFRYCEWIFPILEEFEKHIDKSEKRLFVSERLTGIFIHDLLEKGKKGLGLPLAFVSDKVSVPVAIPFRGEIFPVAVTLQSVLENAEKNTTLNIKILSETELPEETKAKFLSLISEKNSVHSMSFVDVSALNGGRVASPDQFPMFLTEIFGENKCLYITRNAIACRDIAEFFRTCGVDDYRIVGPAASGGGISDDLLVLNLGWLRKHNAFEHFRFILAQTPSVSAMETMLSFAKDEIGTVPAGFYTSAAKHGIAAEEWPRSVLLERAYWRTWVLYGEKAPWEDILGIYSPVWWRFASTLTDIFPFDCANFENVGDYYAENYMLIADTLTDKYKNTNADKRHIVRRACSYYKKYGLKNTLRKIKLTFSGKGGRA